KQLFNFVLKKAKKSTNTNFLLDLFRRSRKSLIFYSALFLYDEGWNNLSPKNRRIPRAETVHRSGIAKSHAWECSIAQESQNLTRGSRPPLRNRKILCVGVLHRSEIAESHARQRSTARKMQNPARRSHPPLRNRRIPRAGTVYHSGIAESHAQERSTARK